jgi:hypothetical protein
MKDIFWKRKKEVHAMMDMLYIGVALLFFVLSWGLVKLSERL